MYIYEIPECCGIQGLCTVKCHGYKKITCKLHGTVHLVYMHMYTESNDTLANLYILVSILQIQNVKPSGQWNTNLEKCRGTK